MCFWLCVQFTQYITQAGHTKCSLQLLSSAAKIRIYRYRWCSLNTLPPRILFIYIYKIHKVCNGDAFITSQIVNNNNNDVKQACCLGFVEVQSETTMAYYIFGLRRHVAQVLLPGLARKFIILECLENLCMCIICICSLVSKDRKQKFGVSTIL